MIPPSPTNLQVSRRVPLLSETERPYERNRALIFWLHVRFDPMKPESLKSMTKQKRYSFFHKALTGIGGSSIEAEISTPEDTADDLAEVRATDDPMIAEMPDKAIALTVGSSSVNVRQESLSSARGVGPRSVMRSTLPSQLKKLSSILDRRVAEAHAVPYYKLALGREFSAVGHAGV